jgi:uncharacterized SAM-binding protein YcdF (DUF218 family)
MSETVSKTKGQQKFILRLAVALILTCLFSGFFLAKPLLFVEGGNRKADVIVVLEGESADRAFRALELYKAGAAPRILVSEGRDCTLIRDRLSLAGVPEQDLFAETRSRNTKENAEFSVLWLKEHAVKRAIIVTSWYHSRRALACFCHFGPGIEFSSFPAYQGMNMDHKPGLSEAPSVFHEYVGLAWYWLRHGVVPGSLRLGTPASSRDAQSLLYGHGVEPTRSCCCPSTLTDHACSISELPTI